MRIILFVLFLSLTPIKAKATALAFTMGYGQGGDYLKDFTGGDFNTKAGSGFLLLGGVTFPISPTFPHRFEAQLNAGFLMQDDARKEESKTTWARWPVELLYYYNNLRNQYRVGYGVTYHFHNRLTGKGENASVQTNFDNAFGYILAAEKMFEANIGGTWGLGLRYTWIDYKAPTLTRTVNGNALIATFTVLTDEF